MTVKELREWLDDFDDDVNVEVVVREISYRGYGANDYVYCTDLDVDNRDTWEYYDYAGSKVLTFGSTAG